jgi:phosphopantetheinyl transferase (holo-ACP synthase)
VKSTGNDIVALNFTNRQRTSQSAFYSKFITTAEQALHEPELPFEAFVWLLWSVKEAAYKFLKRNDTELVFSPSKITIQNIQQLIDAPLTQFEADGWEQSPADNFYSGEIHYQDQTLYFLSIIHPEFIATVVNNAPAFEHIYWGVQLIKEPDSASQSEVVRSFTLNKLSKLFPGDDLQFDKTTAGYPVLISNEKETDVPVSFAHHGNYVSYSLVYPV